MSYSVMSMEEEAKDFVVKVQKDNNLASQSQAIYLLKDLYEKKKKKVEVNV